MKSRRHSRILIIDDENAMLKLLCRIVFKFDSTVEVDMAQSAEEGIQKVHNTPYDLILTDIKMPGMSGNDFFDYVKNNVEQSIPIIAMSGTPWLLDESDFDAVISKPFYKEELVGMVRKFIQGSELQ